jgi:FSR family fosmidomycin resistance protein-like MFS transporter
VLLVAAALVGVGSSVFHPEASRVAHAAAGPRPGFAQSLFQTGGSVGGALGVLGAAAVVAADGQASVAWFAVLALMATAILTWVGGWYKSHGVARARATHRARPREAQPRPVVIRAMAILLVLMFSKFVYLAGLGSYYTFYLIHKFGVSVQTAQLYLFAFIAAASIGIVAGGPIGDRFGRKYLIWFSILGTLPFSLALPYANLFWTCILSTCAGFILSSAFAAMVVYGQELVPGKVGMISGLFFGLSFGLGGLAAAALGWLADQTSIGFVYKVCAFLPALGILAAFLPDLHWRERTA